MLPSMTNSLYVLIMAGGEGTRFSPVSTPEKPKQFLRFWGERTFLQQAYDRVVDMVSPSNICISTNEKYTHYVEEQLPNMDTKNILGETVKKNTAPGIAYIAQKIARKDKDSVLLVVPSDHLINKVEDFRQSVRKAACIAAEWNVLVTLGIEPTWPADCYGYIKLGKGAGNGAHEKWNAYAVESFIEKPSIERAKQFINEKGYVWNSGMFIWRSEIILEEIEKYLPKMKKLLDRYCLDEACSNESVKSYFDEVESISIDYGVMEKSKRVFTIPCELGWSDIGTWKSLYRLVKSGAIRLEPKIERVMKEKIGVINENS